MSSLISVIIPAYNHALYVADAVESVISQTYKNIELIVVDDGSQDETWSVLENLRAKCEERFVRVVFLRQENQGTCRTLNTLISLAEGEFVHLLASDDKFSSCAAQALYDAIKDDPACVLAVGRNVLIDADGKECYWDSERNITYDRSHATYLSFSDALMKKRKDVDFYSDSFGSYSSLLRGNYIPNGYLIRKSVFDKIEKFSIDAPLEDYFLHLQLAKCGTMKCIPELTFYYRWHGKNTVTRHHHMSEMTKKTVQYEQKKLQQAGNENFLIILKQYLQGTKKLVWGSPSSICFYKVSSPIYSRYIMSIFGKEFILRERKKNSYYSV